MDPQALRALPLDDYAAWMLEHGYYDVDVTTGVVSNARTGRPLKPKDNGHGYLVVRFTYGRACQRTVKVHRLVAIKLWGVEAVRGKQIGHRNGHTVVNTVDELWLPQTAWEHIQHDGTDANLGPRPIKTAWPLCVLCRTPAGRPGDHMRTPVRITGERFGIDGDLCDRCYHRLYRREWRARRREARPKHTT